MSRRLLFIFSIFFFGYTALAQISIATDVSILRSIGRGQGFWAIGQTVKGIFHVHEKGSAYASFAYYTPGGFKDHFTAQARSGTTQPQQLPFTVTSSLRLSQLTLGWQQYFKGSFAMEEGLSIYGYGGFGLMMGKAQNSYSLMPDTSVYDISPAPREGGARFKRLTLEFAGGVEMPVSMDIFLYTELRSWMVTSAYPSAHIYRNEGRPLTVSINGGLRILF